MRGKTILYGCAGFAMLLFPLLCRGQEFFPNTESASNLPKGALSIKFANEFYKDETALRLWQGYTVAYGISSKDNDK